MEAVGPEFTSRQIRIALLRPPCVVLPTALAGGGPMPPIGLAYVAAALRQEGHEVQVIDAPGEAMDHHREYTSVVGRLRQIGLSPNEIVQRIDARTRLVGISHMFLHEWPVVREIAELVKRRLPDAVIVVGGDNASGFWPWIFEQTDAVDCVARGEGERTAVELAHRIAAGRSFTDIDGLAVRPGVESPVPAPIDNGLPVRLRRLGEVSRPAWDLFPLESYFSERSFYGVDRGRTMPFLATRGCPYKCTFCSSPQVWSTRYIVRDPDDIADEIACYVDTYGVENIDFVDLTAMTKRQWTLDFCDALDRRGLRISWQLPVGTRSEGIDAEVLRRMWQTGCRNITFAPESGSQRMLEIFDKRLDLDHLLDDVRVAAQLGMVVHLNTIIGHPQERWSDRWQNLRFLARAGWAGAETGSAAIFHPYPGSKDFDDLFAAGRIHMDERFYYDGLAKTSALTTSWNDQVSARQLYALQLLMIATCYTAGVIARPRRFLHLLGVLAGRRRDENFLEQQLRARLGAGPLSAVRRSSRAQRPLSVSSPTPAVDPPETTSGAGTAAAVLAD